MRACDFEAVCCRLHLAAEAITVADGPRPAPILLRCRLPGIVEGAAKTIRAEAVAAVDHASAAHEAGDDIGSRRLIAATIRKDRVSKALGAFRCARGDGVHNCTGGEVLASLRARRGGCLVGSAAESLLVPMGDFRTSWHRKPLTTLASGSTFHPPRRIAEASAARRSRRCRRNDRCWL